MLANEVEAEVGVCLSSVAAAACFESFGVVDSDCGTADSAVVASDGLPLLVEWSHER